MFISLTTYHVCKVKFWYKNCYCVHEGVYLSVKSNPITGPYSRWGLQEVEAPRFQVSRHMKVVRLSAVRTGRLNPPGKIPSTHFCYNLSRPQGHSAAGRIMSMKNSNDTIGNRTRDLPNYQICILCSFLFLSMEFLEIQVVLKVLRWFETSVNVSRHRVTSQKSIVSSTVMRVSAFVVFRIGCAC